VSAARVLQPPAGAFEDAEVSRSRPTNVSARRTREEIAELRAAIVELLEEEQPCTVRQVFYRLVSAGRIAKTEGEYKTTVVRLLGEMRRSGDLPYEWIADSTRWMRKPRTYSGMQDMLERTAANYRRSLWDDVDAYVEIWLEKEALAGVIYQETEQWDVPLMVTRGYPSLSFLHGAAAAISEVARDTFIFYVGDHDPSGVDISRNVEQRIRQFAPEVDLTFERLAVTPEQIGRLELPTRPTKKTDSRSANFEGGSVEADAIEPWMLRELVREAIERHLPEEQVERTRVVEREERATLRQYARTFGQRQGAST